MHPVIPAIAHQHRDRLSGTYVRVVGGQKLGQSVSLMLRHCGASVVHFTQSLQALAWLESATVPLDAGVVDLDADPSTEPGPTDVLATLIQRISACWSVLVGARTDKDEVDRFLRMPGVVDYLPKPAWAPELAGAVADAVSRSRGRRARLEQVDSRRELPPANEVQPVLGLTEEDDTLFSVQEDAVLAFENELVRLQQLLPTTRTARAVLFLMLMGLEDKEIAQATGLDLPRTKREVAKVLRAVGSGSRKSLRRAQLERAGIDAAHFMDARLAGCGFRNGRKSRLGPRATYDGTKKAAQT